MTGYIRTKEGKRLHSVFDKENEEEESDSDPGDIVYDDYEQDEEGSTALCYRCDHFGTQTDCKLYANFVSEESGWCTKIKGNTKIVRKDHHCEGWSNEAEKVLHKSW